MSLRMIADVLKARDVWTHCPLCGRTFTRFPSNEEHIFPQWLQHHHDLWNSKLNIPNFIGKRYSTVKIDICMRCNGKTFGQLEARVAPLLTSQNPFAAAQSLGDDELAIWLGKIFWLLIRKSHSVMDYRTRDLLQPDRIIPADLFPGTLFLGMIERAFATGKGFFSCYKTDPPIPEFFYGNPFSLYRFRIDTSDSRFGKFDFIDNPMTLSMGFRSDNLGIVCLFDGGLHSRFRKPWYDFLSGEPLHPTQFSEVTARMIYDQTVLHEDAQRLTYYWNPLLNAVVAQGHTPRLFNPYMAEHHDPALLASLIARVTSHDPAQFLLSNGGVVTCLHDSEGRFLRFAVTEAEIAASRADPNQVVLGPAHTDWRVREHGPKKGD